MNKTLPASDNIIPFVNRYNHISVVDLENIMEDFETMGYLSKKGDEFRTAFWGLFIKDSKGG